ncbi:MAG: glycosyltransferase family 4 protein, partial [Phycisphaerae bacterium]|nr:glycosyltransferase family 4 protein [Phycisphaerae bacterium]NIU07531.1 glycosyltransferase family 4 protein [Phycisphaerae bacterium]NIX29579.1 glycosyltransferase [Phycisphaerae bacterium]
MHKILFVATIAGTLRAFLLPFADHFRSRGWQVDAVAKGVADCAECKKYFDNVYDIPWSRSLLAPENWLRAPRRITQIVRDGRYDLVHVHTPIAAAISRHALRKIRLNRGLKVIYTAHGLHFSGDKKASSDKIFVLAEKLAAKWTDYLIVMNQEDYNSVLKYKIAAESQLIYMPGIGVDTNFYKSERPKKNQKERFKQDLGLVSEDKYFLIVAEFNKRKHHDHAIRALSMLGKTDVHLVLAGEGPLKDDMRRLAQRLGIGAQVHFLGFRRDIPRLMQFSNGLILPSSREGLPRCVMEA